MKKKYIPDNMKNKTVLVTGANSGTGYVTAMELAKADAEVVMLCRNPEKWGKARIQIMNESGNKKIELITADLSELDEVKNAADTFAEKYEKLDCLILNAGGIYEERQLSRQGLEKSLTGNYLGDVLLTELLLEKLKNAQNARIVVVSSVAHTYGHLDYSDLQTEKDYTYRKAYSQAKLAVLMWSYALARRFKSSGITVNAMHPGAVNSGFQNKMSQKHKNQLGIVFKLLGKAPDIPAGTILYLACDAKVANESGNYYYNYKKTRSSKITYNVKEQKKLIKVTYRMLQELGYIKEAGSLWKR